MQPQPRKGLSTGAIVAIVIGGVIAVCCIAGLIMYAITPGTVRNAASRADGPQMQTSTSAAPAAAAPKASFYQPQPADFVLTAKVLEKSCFGSAGCNVQYRIEVTYNGAPLDPSKTYEVTYEVNGGEDPEINTLEVTGTKYSADDRESIGTKSSKTELTVTVTSVSMRLR